MKFWFWKPLLIYKNEMMFVCLFVSELQEPKKRKVVKLSSDDDSEDEKENHNEDDPKHSQPYDLEVKKERVSKDEDENKKKEGEDATKEKMAANASGTQGTPKNLETFGKVEKVVAPDLQLVSTTSNKQLFGKNYPHAEVNIFFFLTFF